MTRLPARRRVRTVGKRAFLALHRLALRAGIVVLPRHYYVPIPDINALRRTRDAWNRRSSMAGVLVDLDAQVEALREMVLPYRSEYVGGLTAWRADDRDLGPGFGEVEGQALHAMVRHLKPRRVVEVGSGVSTRIVLDAAARNGTPTAVTCVEPYPAGWLRKAPVTLIERPVQALDPSFVDELEAGDLLFIDSTHTVQTGGDVPFLVLEVLPRLRAGVVVHIHDIFLPYDFQRDADRTFLHWQETALVHAFLVGNRSVEILFCLSQLHYDRPDVLQEAFPGYRPEADEGGLRSDAYPAFGGSGRHFPASLYLRVVGDGDAAAT